MNNTICHNRENEFVNFCCTETSISKNESVPCTNQQIHFRRRMKKKDKCATLQYKTMNISTTDYYCYYTLTFSNGEQNNNNNRK